MARETAIRETGAEADSESPFVARRNGEIASSHAWHILRLIRPSASIPAGDRGTDETEARRGKLYRVMPNIPFAKWVNSAVEASARYGAIESGMWPDVGKWCALIELPPFMANVKNSLTGFPVSHLYLNIDMRAPLLAALNSVNNAGLISEIRTFDGCYNCRPVRGSSPPEWSSHSWALAIDLNAKENQLGTHGNMHPRVVSAFEAIGFKWGGRFNRLDPMHFSWGGW